MISKSICSSGSSGKGKNGIRANVLGSLKGGTFITPKVKYNGHH